MDLAIPAPPWLRLWVEDYDAASTAVWTLRGHPGMRGKFIGTVRGHKMRERAGVFNQLGALFQFPAYFGENWDAFADCINDLDWLRADGFLLVVYDSENVLADGDHDELGLFLGLLTEAGQSFSAADEFRPSAPFHVILQAAAEPADVLKRRLKEAGHDLPLTRLPAE